MVIIDNPNIAAILAEHTSTAVVVADTILAKDTASMAATAILVEHTTATVKAAPSAA